MIEFNDIAQLRPATRARVMGKFCRPGLFASFALSGKALIGMGFMFGRRLLRPIPAQERRQSRAR
jgi:hypothetical protein